MPAMMLIALILLLLLASICAEDDACSVPVGRPSCVCDTGAKGIIDLTSIAGVGAPKFVGIKDNRQGADFNYSYNPCYGFTDGGRCEDVAACQITPDDKYGLGTMDTEIIIYDGQNAYLQYRNGEEGRSTQVSLVCEWDRYEPLLHANGDPTIMIYNFVLYSRCACPGGCGPASEGVAPGIVGIVLIMLALVSVAVYFIIGSLVMALQYNKTGLDIVPNRRFWQDIPYLVKDGVLFIWRPLYDALKRNDYEQLLDQK